MNKDFVKMGLSSAQAAEQIKKIGLNELPQSIQESIFKKITKLFKEPMLLLLLAAGAIYLVMGDLGEGLMLGASIFFVIGIFCDWDFLLSREKIRKCLGCAQGSF